MERFIIRISLLLLMMHSTISLAKGAQYPIILVHGTLGFAEYQEIDYFYKVPQALEKKGHQVFVASVSSVNSHVVRGEQLLAFVEEVLAITGSEKVHLMGHSQGSPTARYVAKIVPDYVASVTSIGGVNQGSPVADVLAQMLSQGQLDPFLVQQLFALIQKIDEAYSNPRAFKPALKRNSDDDQDISDPEPSDPEPIEELAAREDAPQDVDISIVTLVSQLTNLGQILSQENQQQDVVAALISISSLGSQAFNQEVSAGLPPTGCGEGAHEVDGVLYYSWGGNVAMTNIDDPMDQVMGLLAVAFPQGVEHDGLVSVCSSHLGQVIRDDYPLNHYDQVNQLLGVVGSEGRHGLKGAVNPVALFKQQANRLARQGL